ncbi:MAG: ABC transporter substrate-binding protein [Mycobacterium sp.]|nr:ABC transporter substrate-binding protein [Mycobacterium sp.]
MNLSLSGPGAVLCQPGLRGLLVQLDTINSTGGVNGRKIEILKRDDKTNPKLSAKIAQEFADRKVAAMVGPMMTEPAVDLTGLPEKLHLPTISLASTSVNVTPVSKHPYTFKVSPSNADMATVQAQELARRKIENVAFITVKGPYGNSATAGFKAAANKAGINVVSVQQFSQTATNLMPQVQAAQEAGAKGFAVSVYPPQSAILAKTVKASGFDGPVIFDAAAGAELFVEGAGRASEGMFMVYDRIMASDSEAVTSPAAWRQRQFFTKYAQKYGGFSGFAALGADGLQLVAMAVQSAGSTAPQHIQHALEHIRYDGLAGSYVYTPKAHGGMTLDSLMVLTVKDGGWVPGE